MTPARITIIQPALPSYRIDLFNRLAETFGERFTVYTSPTDMGALTKRADSPRWQAQLGPIRRLFNRIEWQVGALNVPIRKGDVVIINGAPRCLTNLILLLKARTKGARTIWWGHYWSSTSRRWRQKLRLQMMLLSDMQIFYTDAEVLEYKMLLGREPGSRVSALNNGINVQALEPYRAPYAAHSRARAILFIGRLEPKAHLEVLLRAMASPKLSDVTLHVVGDGTSRPELTELAQQLAISDRVIWHGGTTEEAEIALRANLCRVFVYPGEVGLSLVHGMAYGLPAVIHSDRWKHMPEVAAFQDGQTGRTFELGRADSLAATIGCLIDDHDELERMSKLCLETVHSRFNTAAMAKRFIAAIQRLESLLVPK